jgi:hypothetical protein
MEEHKMVPESSGDLQPPGGSPPTAIGAATPEPNPRLQILESWSSPPKQTQFPWALVSLVVELSATWIRSAMAWLAARWQRNPWDRRA